VCVQLPDRPEGTLNPSQVSWVPLAAAMNAYARTRHSHHLILLLLLLLLLCLQVRDCPEGRVGSAGSHWCRRPDQAGINDR
jgi:hypothetical protein